MQSFETATAAREFVREQVDVPVAEQVEMVNDRFVLHTFSQELEEGKFTNVYDLSFPEDRVRTRVELRDDLTSVFDYIASVPNLQAATGGGFFFLADQASAPPRQFSLNLALIDGQVHSSFPVADREAVLSDGERLVAERLQALGAMSINGAELSWSGSLTGHDTEAKVFGNGNCVITHVHNDATGSIRALDESSRYTPPITDDAVDIGFIRREDGVFAAIDSSTSGGIDTFTHDVIVRTHERYMRHGLPEMRLHTLGGKAIDGALQGAISVGPMLDEADFTSHAINSDKSLGSNPPFLEIPLARTALYKMGNGMVHVRLLDGRPGSQIFPGVTPQQVVEAIGSEGAVAWGCFLDPGQTAKLVVRKQDDHLASYGNTHYLKWPQQPGEKFIWVPRTGRPVTSMITLR